MNINKKTIKRLVESQQNWKSKAINRGAINRRICARIKEIEFSRDSWRKKFEDCKDHNKFLTGELEKKSLQMLI